LLDLCQVVVAKLDVERAERLCEALALALAMQKVVGSSPIIRLIACKRASLGVSFDNR